MEELLGLDSDWENQWPSMPSALLIYCRPRWAYGVDRLEAESCFFYFLRIGGIYDDLCDIYIGF